MEDVGACVAFFVGTLVGEGDGDASVEVGELTHAVGENVVAVGGDGEDGVVRPEVLACASDVGGAYYFYGCLWLALGILLAIDFAVAEDLGDHAGGQGVDAADTDAVETAGDLVGAFVELAACMEHCHDDFEG